jgi:hypothetical protein
MPLFPDEFPFKRPGSSSSAAPAPQAPPPQVIPAEAWPLPPAPPPEVIAAGAIPRDAPAPQAQPSSTPASQAVTAQIVQAPATQASVVTAPAQFVPPPVSEFELPIAPAQGQSAQAAEGQERRRSPRQTFLARAQLRHDMGNAPGWRVDLLNLSMLGARVRSNMSLMPGDKAQLKLEVGPLRWGTKLRVVHCSKLDDGNFAIGCEFVANELIRPLVRAAA